MKNKNRRTKEMKIEVKETNISKTFQKLVKNEYKTKLLKGKISFRK